MRITILKIALLNFQGIRELSIEFDNQTSIFGDNATGKTTIANAFTWLLFGKNLADQKQFEVKTLDEKNQVIPKLNHEVEAVLLIDGEKVELKRTLKEKWVKKRGEAEATFQGNTEEFFINNVPFKKTDYEREINGYISESQFKLLTNPLYMNSTMDWKARRNLLFKMAGSVSYEDIAKSHPELQPLVEKVTKKSIEGYRKELLARKKKLNEMLKEIPSRIDEVSRSMPEMPDEKTINNEIYKLTAELDKLNGNLEAVFNANKEKEEEYDKITKQISSVQDDIDKLEIAARIEANSRNQKSSSGLFSIEGKIKNKRVAVQSNTQSIKMLSNSRKELEETIERLRQEFIELEESEPVVDVKTVCPTCGQDLPGDDVEEERQKLITKFNEDKVKRQDQIDERGREIKEKLESFVSKIDDLEKENLQNQKEIEQLEEQLNVPKEAPVTTEQILEGNKKYEWLQEQLKQLRKQRDKLSEETKNSVPAELKERKKEITDQVSSLKIQLKDKEIIESKNNRINQLEHDSKDYSQQLADAEKEEFLLQEFNKAFISGTEEAINSLFPTVNFRLFREQINGGEEEDCTLLLNGVPWNDINSAAKIQAGIECINAVSKHFGYSAPIWVDNAESVVELPKTDSQVIRLVVSEDDKQLKVK